MIQKMGEHIHGWIAGIIVVGISITFALWGIGYFIGNTSPSATVIAKVNGQTLTAQALNTQFQNLTTTNPALASASPSERLRVKQQLVKQWVEQTAVQTTLSNAGMMVGPEVVRNMVLANPQFQVKGQFSPYLFQAFLMQNQITENDLYDRVSQGWATQVFMQTLQQSALVLPSEIARYYQLLTQKRSFRYHIFQSHDYLNQVHLSDQDLQNYYQHHQADFRVPEKVSIDYIALTPALVQSDVHVTEKAMHTYYDNQIQQYTEGKKVKPFAQVEKSIYAMLAKKQVNQLLSQKSDQLTNLTLSHPDGLVEVAKTAGVTLQHTVPFTRQGLESGPAADPKVVAAAFGDIVLTQGMNSDPITIADGSVVYIHLRKHIPAHVLPYERVKAKVKTLFMQNAAQQLALQHAQAIVNQLNQSQSVPLSWTSFQHVGMNQKQIPSAIKTAVFNAPFAAKQAPAAIVVPIGDNAVAVAQIQQVFVNPVAKMSAKEASSIRTNLLTQRANTLAALMNSSLYQHSKIHLYLNKIAH